MEREMGFEPTASSLAVSGSIECKEQWRSRGCYRSKEISNFRNFASQTDRNFSRERSAAGGARPGPSRLRLSRRRRYRQAPALEVGDEKRGYRKLASRADFVP